MEAEREKAVVGSSAKHLIRIFGNESTKGRILAGL